MIPFLILLLTPTLIGLIVCYLLVRDDKETKRKEDLKKKSTSIGRFFVIRKRINILCTAHLSHLNKNEIALIDQTRCKICLAISGKV